MMFGMVLRVMEKIWKKVGFSRFLAKKHGLTPWDFGQNFKFAQTFCIGKRSREMMFGFKSLEKIWKKVGLAQKAWTNPLGFWSKFQICSNFLYR